MNSLGGTIGPRNARAEAQAMVGDSFNALVLEPSPPAIDDGEWFADDPVKSEASAVSILFPSGMAEGGEVSDWSAWLRNNPGHEGWVKDRWLGGSKRLPRPTDALSGTRTDLHRLAAYVIAPARHTTNGKFGLRWTLGGFGTPFFGADRQVRVAGDLLVDQQGPNVRTVQITTLSAAARFLETTISTDAGAEHDSPPLGDVDAPLDIDIDSSNFLGAWYGMAFAALERVRAHDGSVDPSRPQLWPGHFDPAIEVGDEDHRVSFGASPGDAAIDEPYLYVSVWWPDRLELDDADPMWNAPSFTGAILKLSQFGDVFDNAGALDPVDVATDFWVGVRDRLG